MERRTVSSAENWLKFLLRVNGLLSVMAIVAVVMPHSWLIWCVGKVDPNLPVLPLVSYLARFLSAFFVLFGVMLLIFATDVRRYMQPIRLTMLWCWFVFAALLLHAIPHAPILLRQSFFWLIAIDGVYGLTISSTILLLLRSIARQDTE